MLYLWGGLGPTGPFDRRREFFASIHQDRDAVWRVDVDGGSVLG